MHVYQGTVDGAELSSTYYSLPAVVGSTLKILSEADGVLSISSSDGTSNTFDIASGTIK